MVASCLAVMENGPENLGVEEKGATAVVKEDETNLLTQYGVERKSDGFIYWKSDSSDHPRRWSSSRKLFDTSIIIILEFYT